MRVFVLMLTDALVMTSVWAFDVWFYQLLGAKYRFGWEFYLRLWPTLLVFVALNAAFRLYHGRVAYPGAPVSPVEEMRRLFASAALTHIGLIAYIALAHRTVKENSRVVMVFSGILTALLAQPARDLVRLVLFRFRAFRIPAAVTGPTEGSEVIRKALENDAYLGFRPADEGEKAELLFTCEDSASFRANYPGYAKRYSQIEYFPSSGTLPVAGSRPVTLDGVGGIEFVNQRRMAMLRNEKWLLDKTLAVLAFLVLSPFFILVPLLVKLTSKGPVFYRHDRLGKKGRSIRVWKFRTMYVDADDRLKALLEADPAKREEWEKNFKLADDPRVTPLGRFLRKTSIDEFPQLFNVFSGEMALVGPRPIVADEVPYYGDSYEVFSSVKPGITGLWQASGRSDTNYARRVALDVHYVLNWSPWLDLWILKKTVGAVLFMRGAR